MIRLFLKWFIISTIVLSSFYSASFTAYSYIVYGPDNYEHLPSYPILRILWAIGIPGSIILLVVFILLSGALVITVCNWLLFGKFKLTLDD